MPAGPPRRRPARWDNAAVLGLVSLIAGPFVLPIIAPAIGGAFIRASTTWTRREKRIGSIAALTPCAVLAVLLLLFLATSIESTPGPIVSIASTASALVCVGAGLLLIYLPMRRTSPGRTAPVANDSISEAPDLCDD